jgi:predicted nuclease of predicted toxin-antitoxin system
MGVSPKAVEVLTALGHSAEHVQSLGMSAADDATIFQHAVRHDCIVVTTDLDFGHIAVTRTRPFPGLILLRLDSPNAREMCDCLQRYLADRDASDYRSCIVVLERGRWRRMVIPLQ